MPDELEERLKSHARSFDSLLSLIPAKLYYGEDVSDQWKRKKQTPEQKRAAKMAKLDPDNWKSAKDVADEREAAARKRKREENDESSDIDLIEPEKPKIELDLDNPKTKKRKITDSRPDSSAEKQNDRIKSEETPEERRQREKEKRAAKKERKRERKEKARLRLERQQTRRKAEKAQRREEKHSKKPKSESRPAKPEENVGEALSEQGADDENIAEAIAIDQPCAFASNSHIEDHQSSIGSSEDGKTEVFSPYHESGISSISSILPPTTDETPDSQSHQQSLQTQQTSPSEPGKPTPKSQPQSEPSTSTSDTQSDPKARLAAALTTFRSARIPSNPTKIQPKSRAELLAQRRAAEERKKADKKAQRAREMEEEARKQEEEIAKRFSPGGSGSLFGSPCSPIIHSPPSESNNFSFGRIAFEDGSSLTPDGTVVEHGRKGPQDPRTALTAAQAKHARISGLDAEKRETIESKNLWNAARKRASGEKVKDDTSLLKKALKRHDSQKKKSEKEWNERQDGVRKSMEMKQKKRNENIAKRRDEKGGGKGKKAKRPGFEGSFKGRTGGKRK